MWSILHNCKIHLHEKGKYMIQDRFFPFFLLPNFERERGRELMHFPWHIYWNQRKLNSLSIFTGSSTMQCTATYTKHNGLPNWGEWKSSPIVYSVSLQLCPILDLSRSNFGNLVTIFCSLFFEVWGGKK